MKDSDGRSLIVAFYNDPQKSEDVKDTIEKLKEKYDDVVVKFPEKDGVKYIEYWGIAKNGGSNNDK